MHGLQKVLPSVSHRGPAGSFRLDHGIDGALIFFGGGGQRVPESA